jgi:hypothetical protein
VDEETTEHQHVFVVTLGGNLGQEEEHEPWAATCRECGYTECGDDARTQLGISSWSGSTGDAGTTG